MSLARTLQRKKDKEKYKEFKKKHKVNDKSVSRELQMQGLIYTKKASLKDIKEWVL